MTGRRACGIPKRYDHERYEHNVFGVAHLIYSIQSCRLITVPKTSTTRTKRDLHFVRTSETDPTNRLPLTTPNRSHDDGHRQHAHHTNKMGCGKNGLCVTPRPGDETRRKSKTSTTLATLSTGTFPWPAEFLDTHTFNNESISTLRRQRQRRSS